MEWIIKLVITCILGLLAVVDFKKKRVSNVLLLIVSGIVIINYIIFKPTTIMSLAGGILIGVILLGISYITRQRIGAGDGLLIMILGAYLGFEAIGVVLLYALTLSAIWSVLLLMIKKVNRHHEVAFVPFIFVGYIGVLLHV